MPQKIGEAAATGACFQGTRGEAKLDVGRLPPGLGVRKSSASLALFRSPALVSLLPFYLGQDLS